jgi:hypothetical protein
VVHLVELIQLSPGGVEVFLMRGLDFGVDSDCGDCPSFVFPVLDLDFGALPVGAGSDWFEIFSSAFRFTSSPILLTC